MRQCAHCHNIVIYCPAMLVLQKYAQKYFFSLFLSTNLLEVGVLAANRQISLSASAERAFANFRDKKHRILQLQIVRTKNIVFETKNVVFLQLHENGHFHGATFISDDLSVHYDSYILAHTVIGP